MPSKINIAIVEDNHFLMLAIKDKLSFFDEINIRFVAENGAIALDNLLKDKHIDLIIMDIEMPVMNGIVATEKIKSLYPQIKIIILTVFDNDEHIFHAIKAGADGYLLKEIEPQKLYNDILQTLDGGAVMNPSIAMKTLKLLREPTIPSPQESQEINLSEREIDVLEQICKGLSYTAIAENLFVSPSTVRKHTENIYKKLQVHSKLEAIEKAKQNRLI